jgi:hypothetical protein
MKMTLAATCPYCSKNIEYRVKATFTRNRNIYFCDPDRNGCNRYFVVSSLITVQTESKKIEGQEEPHQLKSVK